MNSASRAFAPLDLLQLVAVPLIWGVNNVAAMIAVRELPPLMVAGLRFTIVLACLFWALRRPPAGRLWLFAAMLAFLGPVHFGLQYGGLGRARELAPMVVAMQLWIPASVVFASLLLRERVSVLRWGGVVIAFAGAAGMTFDPGVLAQLPALGLVGLGSVCYGLGSVLVRRLGAAMDPWAMQAWLALACAPALLSGSLALEHSHAAKLASASWLAWACVMFGALASTVVANFFLFKLLRKYEVSRTTPYMLIAPVISFVLAALVLGDEITGQIVAGAGLAIAGVALVALAERRRT